MNQINSFRGLYSFLSNFSPHSVTYNGITFKTSEHAFHWEKAETESDKQLILQAVSPVEAKKIARAFKIDIAHWEARRVGAMEDILVEKFKSKNLKTLLQNTAGFELVEGNYWHDNFWGACMCNRCEPKEKLNNLGKILMKVRGNNH
jgi:hypothetical protein